MLMICIFMLSWACLDADIFTADQTKELDDFVNNLMSCSKVPAFTLAVVKGNETFTRTYGFSDVENKVLATEDTLFCIGSITKSFTTTLLSKLLPQAYPKSSWDTKLKEILGGSFKLFTDELTDHATLKDILTHRTGLVNGNYGIFAGYPKTLSRQTLASKLRYLPNSQPLRYHFDYNNFMYFLAGYMTEVITGGHTSWEDLLTQHILQPLRMTSTVVLTDLNELTKSTQTALPYIFQDGQFQLMPFDIYSIHPAESAGAMCSPTTDMSRWMQFLLQTPGTPRLRDIVNVTAAFSDTMKPLQLTPQYVSAGMKRPTFPVDNFQFAYGMGWFTGTYRGHETTSHSGSLFAYNSLLTLFRASNFGIYVSINGIPDENKKINSLVTSFVSDLVLGESPWLNESTACSFPQPWVEDKRNQSSHSNGSDNNPGVTPQRPLAAYTGTFGHRIIGDIQITVATQNSLKLSMGRAQALLFPTSVKDEFRWEIIGLYKFLSPNNTARFYKTHFYDTNGQIDALSCDAIGKEFVFRTNVRFDDSSSGYRSGSYSIFNTFAVLYALLKVSVD